MKCTRAPPPNRPAASRNAVSTGRLGNCPASSRWMVRDPAPAGPRVLPPGTAVWGAPWRGTTAARRTARRGRRRRCRGGRARRVTGSRVRHRRGRRRRRRGERRESQLIAQRNHRQAHRRAEAPASPAVRGSRRAARRMCSTAARTAVEVQTSASQGCVGAEQVPSEGADDRGRGDGVGHAAEAVVALVAEAAVPRLLVQAWRGPVDGPGGPQGLPVQGAGPDRLAPGSRSSCPASARKSSKCGRESMSAIRRSVPPCSMKPFRKPAPADCRPMTAFLSTRNPSG